MSATPQERQIVPPLRAVREARGMSIRETARLASLDPTFLSRVERGQDRLSVRSLERVAKALGLRELAKLLAPWVGENGDAQPPQ
jgi:transcriptional regulator with XRE-family HTH domain